MLLSASALCIGRGDRRLLSNLDFVVSAGDVLHLKGRNGAGKSSLIEVLVGLRTPQAGELRRPEPGQVHWIGHRNALNADLSVEENLHCWCRQQGLDTATLLPALERVGLSKLRRRHVRTLSAGQRRRSALARLLLTRRPLWLLDEPLSSLDAEGVSLLGQLMNEHVAGEGAVIVTSHQSLPGRLPRVTVLELT